MSLNENSSRKKVLRYIKKSPFCFLDYFSDETWAQPYLEEAADIAAKKRPFYFIYKYLDFIYKHSDKSWSQSCINESAKNAARLNPKYFLMDFSDKPWAQPYIDDAAKGTAKKEPEYFMKKWADRFPQYINLALFALGSENVSK